MKITLAHGAGGLKMGELIEDIIVANTRLRNVDGGMGLNELDDGGTIPFGDYEIVVATDGHTITPIFFPGGDMGKLSTCGIINDVSVMGARPLAVASSMVIEEGFDSQDLVRIVRSMDLVCVENNVALITGDTKVVEKGSLDRIIITTTCIGMAERGRVIRDDGLSPGDKIILTGTMGDHGVALMSVREGFGFETTLISDVASLWPMINAVVGIGGINAMKDPTRGGVAAALNEWSRKNQLEIILEEDRIPLKKEVIVASEMLGIDPFVMANEGKALIGVSPEKAGKVLEMLKQFETGKDARIIGEARKKGKSRVILKTSVGGKRIIEPPLADPLPRIC